VSQVSQVSQASQVKTERAASPLGGLAAQACREPGDTMGNMPEVVIEDPWQARMDRLKRRMPLPLLLVSTAAALIITAQQHTWSRFELGLPAVAVAALWWTVLTVRGRSGASARGRLMVFAVQTALAGFLVWVSLPYGVFGYTGFLLAYGLGSRWRPFGFAATALVVSAAMVGGYPSSDAGHTVTYLLVAGVLVVLTANSASIANRMIQQNEERGRMIRELAEANRALEASMAENAELHDQLVTQARQAGIVEERQRLAGEIHDTLAQGLTGIIAQLEAAEHTRNHADTWPAHVARARDLARANLTEARRSVRALRPEQLEQASLPEAIAMLARTWSEGSMIEAGVQTIGTVVRADPDTEAAVFRAAQEALSNVTKHARATRVQITLTYLGDTLLLDVADNGTGFDATTATDGYGLVGMRQRLSRVGGTLTVESAPGAGTILNASVPLAGQTDGENT
jgi:signal transduction histidine kinase